MRYTYIRPFIDAAQKVLEQLLASKITTGDVQLSPTSIVSRGVATIVGLTGEAKGRVGNHFVISPPTLLESEHLTISNSELETLVVLVETPFEEVVVNVAITTC